MSDGIVTYCNGEETAIIHFRPTYNREMADLIESHISTLLYINYEVIEIVFDLSELNESEYTEELMRSIFARKEQVIEVDKKFSIFGVRENKVQTMIENGLEETLIPED